MVGKIRDRPKICDNSFQLPAAPAASYIIRTAGNSSTSSSSFKCNGECSFAKQLREDLSVVQQSKDDMMNEYLEKISEPVIPSASNRPPVAPVLVPLARPTSTETPPAAKPKKKKKKKKKGPVELPKEPAPPPISEVVQTTVEEEDL
eukprot:scaffold92205_cov24-Attheya_sp.AAC.1